MHNTRKLFVGHVVLLDICWWIISLLLGMYILRSLYKGKSAPTVPRLTSPLLIIHNVDGSSSDILPQQRFFSGRKKTPKQNKNKNKNKTKLVKNLHIFCHSNVFPLCKTTTTKKKKKTLLEILQTRCHSNVFPLPWVVQRARVGSTRDLGFGSHSK